MPGTNYRPQLFLFVLFSHLQYSFFSFCVGLDYVVFCSELLVFKPPRQLL